MGCDGVVARNEKRLGIKNKLIKLSSCPQGFGDIADPLDETVIAGNPTQHTYDYICDDELGLYVGVWDTTAMIESAKPYPMDEFMLVLEGAATIKNNRTNESVQIGAGQTFAIPKGYDCQWIQEGYLRKFFLIAIPPNGQECDLDETQSLVLPTIASPMVHSTTANPFLRDDSFVHKVYTDYRNQTGEFHVCTWQCGPFKSGFHDFPYNQLSVLQQGSLTVIDDQKISHQFFEGDTFFIPKGLVCAAESLQGATIISASLRPKFVS